MSGKYVPPHRRNQDLPKPVPKKEENTNLVPDSIVAAADHIEKKDEWSLERKLFKNLTNIRRMSIKKEYEDQYINWKKHYEDELEQMYRDCIPPELLITYDRFVYLAYICTQTEVDKQTLKHKRVLV